MVVPPSPAGKQDFFLIVATFLHFALTARRVSLHWWTVPERSQTLRVLVSGAYGLIGNLVYARLADRPDAYSPFGMVRRRQPSGRVGPGGASEILEDRLRLADLEDYAAVRRAVEGMDVVVHMAAEVEGRAGWESILKSNIVGTYNVFEASRDAGVKRIVYASSNQVVFGYRNDEPYRSFFAAPQGRPPKRQSRRSATTSRCAP